MPILQRILELKSTLVVLIFLGFCPGIVVTIQPDLQKSTFGDNAYWISGCLAGLNGFIAIFLSPFIGALSDIRGRRFALLVALTLMFIPFLSYTISNDYWVFSCIQAVMGCYGAALSVAMAVVTDTITMESGNRTEGFSIATAAFVLGLGIGSPVPNYVSNWTAFFLGAIVLAVDAVIVFFVLPVGNSSSRVVSTSVERGEASMGGENGETQHVQQPSATTDEESQINTKASTTVIPTEHTPLSSADSVSEIPQSQRQQQVSPFRKAWNAFRQNKELQLVALITFLDFLAEQMLVTLLLLYLNEELHFTKKYQLLLIAILAMWGFLGLLFVVGPLKRKFGTFKTLRIALTGNAVSIALYAFARKKWQVLAIPVFTVVGFGVFPCCISIAALAVEQKDAGAAQGVASGARMIAEGFSPAVFGVLFQEAKHTSFPGAPFLIASGCVCCALILTVFLKLKDD